MFNATCGRRPTNLASAYRPAYQRSASGVRPKSIAGFTGIHKRLQRQKNDYVGDPVIEQLRANFVDLNRVLLRRTIVCNTDGVIGVVMRTGYDTKLVLTSGGTPSKRGRVERQMNPPVRRRPAYHVRWLRLCALK